MDLQKLKTKRAIVDKAFNIQLEEEHVALGYQLEFSTESNISKTGLLKIFTLQATDPRVARFWGRWDLKEEALDIDIYSVSRIERLLFRTGKRGYNGHHTVRIDKDTRMFQIDLGIPGKQIYKAHISLNINWSLEIFEQAHGSASMSYQVNRI